MNQQNVSARRTWQDFLDKYSSLESPSKDLAERIAEVKYRLAHTYGIPTPKTVGEMELGIALARQFLKTHAGHRLAATTELEIAQAFQRHRRNKDAIDQLEGLIKNDAYQQSKQLAEARRMLGDAYLVQNDFDQAIAAWKIFLENHPTDSAWPEVQKKIISAEFAAAQFAFGEQEYEKARKLWQTFLNKYPLDSRAPLILFRFGEMGYLRANAKIDEQRTSKDADEDAPIDPASRELFEQAISDWGRLVAKYPDSPQASLAALRIGTTLEESLDRRQEAIEAYRKVSGKHEQDAKQRIARLTRPELKLVTKRKFRSDEQASIVLTTRNLENVSVSVYSIDMVDYFRKMHLATAVEQLDIALIDPDDVFHHQVDHYEPFKQIRQDVPIQMDGPGVAAVTVSSDTLEATTMVVVSDLDIVVKSSRNEFFMFAQNMRTGNPADGVSVLISDGASVFSELTTNESGIARSTAKQLQNLSDLRVFATADGHIASTVTNLNGLDFAVGLTSAGFLFTDRPIYRPGETCQHQGNRSPGGERQIYIQAGRDADAGCLRTARS